MANREFAGAATPTTLSAPLTTGASSFTIAAATGWPTGTGSLQFEVVINRGEADEEKILCESRSGTTITVATSGRGHDGTVDQDHAAGATVEHCIDTVWLTEVNAHLNATADAHDYTEITGIDERIRDVIGTAIVAGNNIDVTVSDGSDTITIDVEALTTADLSDFATAVDERARDALGTALVAGTGITITPSDPGDTITVAASVDTSTLPQGLLDYAEITTDFTTTSNSATDVTDLSVTISTDGTRRVRVEIGVSYCERATCLIREGSTNLASWHGQSWNPTPSSPDRVMVSGTRSVILTPSAGSHTYKFSVDNFTNSGPGSPVTLYCSSTNPAYILAEDIGPA